MTLFKLILIVAAIAAIWWVVTSVRASRGASTTAFTPVEDLTPEVRQTIDAALDRGELIGAIKHYRAATGAGLARVQGRRRDPALEARRMSRLPLYGTQGKFTFRLLAMALFGQAIILSFFALVARGNAIADGRPDDGQQLLWVGLGLALLALVASGLMRRPFGVTLGWVVQALTWASALLVPAMIGVAVVFTALWVLLLLQGSKIDRIVAQREADADVEAAAGATPAGD